MIEGRLEGRVTQCGTFPGIAPGKQSRGGPKTIKFGINTKNTGIDRYVRNGRIRGDRYVDNATLPKRPAPVDFGPGAP